MSCYYTFETVHIPRTAVEEVRQLIIKHDLEHVVVLYEEGETPTVPMEVSDGDMSFSTANTISDDFMPEIARIIKGTSEDGQVVYTECGNSRGTLLLVNGTCTEYAGTCGVRDCQGVPIGEEATVTLEYKVIGLPNNRVMVIDG